MKLLRYGPMGQERAGVLDPEGGIRDLSGAVTDITPEVISRQGLAGLRDLNLTSLPRVPGNPRLGTPLRGISKFIAVGLNYSDHAAESGMPVPDEPEIFTKAISCISGPNDPVTIPKNSQKTDWEVELGVVIGTKAQYVPRQTALDHVAGYCVVNDVSERAYQIERGKQWDKGKGFDAFGPIGPYLVTSDEIRDPQTLGLWLEVNGNRYQDGNTKTMIFNVAYLVSYLSEFFTLMPGDVITTGTPPGVGFGMKPPKYLEPGDVMRLGIDGLGEQRQEVFAWPGPR